MAEAAKKTETPKGEASSKPDPNAKNVAPKKEPELTAEEKKVQAEYKKLNEEGAEKAAKINSRLIDQGKPQRVKHEVRNGELTYIWVNEVPVRIMSEDELKAAQEMR